MERMTVAVSESRRLRRSSSRKSSRRAAEGSPSDVLARTRQLAHNLWWTWNGDAQRLFASLDPELWNATGQDPIKTLKLLAPERAAAIAADPNFGEHLT